MGACLYLLFREPVIFTKPLLEGINLPIIPLKDTFIGNVLRYLLPDALWCGALLSYATTIRETWLKLIFAMLPLMLEFGQLFHIVPGTFDIADIITYTLITTIFLIIWKNLKSKSQ